MTIIRGFHHFCEAVYAKTVPLRDGLTDEIMIGLYDTDGGTTGEFAICWLDVGGRSTPQLRAFADSWRALGEFKDLLTAMQTAGTYITPERFCQLLKSLDITDLTHRSLK